MPVELTYQRADTDSKHQYIWEPNNQSLPSWNLHLHGEKLPKTETSTSFQERRTYAKRSIYPDLLGKKWRKEPQV